LTTDQFQPQLSWVRGASCSISAALSGPFTRTSSSTHATSSGCSSAMRRIPPHASVRAAAIRQRSAGCSATGMSEASWPQYSNSSRGAWEAARSSTSVPYGPSLL
jgi:hypothetical protein